MATVLRPPEQRILLDNIPWEIYEALLAAHHDRNVPRFMYDRGQLEIMSPSAEHEQLKETVTLLVNVVAEERASMQKGLARQLSVARIWRVGSSLRPVSTWQTWGM